MLHDASIFENNVFLSPKLIKSSLINDEFSKQKVLAHCNRVQCPLYYLYEGSVKVKNLEMGQFKSRLNGKIKK